MTLKELLVWGHEKGILVSPALEFKEWKHGNIGCFVKTEDVEEPQDLEGKLIRVPTDVAVTSESAAVYFDGKEEGKFHDLRSEMDNPNCLLKIYLAHQRSLKHISTSNIRGYIKSLPSLSQVGTPYFWDSKLKSYIKGSNLGNSLRDNTNILVEEWWSTINLLPESMQKPEEHFINMKFYYEYKFYSDDDLYNYFCEQEKNVDNWTSFPAYLWASIILKSRSFPTYLLKEYVESPSWHIKQNEAMLLPVLDLLNHNYAARVTWAVDRSKNKAYFDFTSDSVTKGEQLFNNYGMKSNEELLLGYGFCLKDNPADTAALKIRISEILIQEFRALGIKIPTIEDYTNSVVAIKEEESGAKQKEGNERDEDMILFFIRKEHVPQNLIEIFLLLVRNKWEKNITLRSKLAGLNQLRFAIESKMLLLPDLQPTQDDNTMRNIEIYIKSQRDIFSSSVKEIKQMEKAILSDPDSRKRLLSLKTVYKRDVKFQQSLLLGFGINSYESLVANGLQDQTWLLYLIRCYNRDEYITLDNSDSVFLPLWIKNAFDKLAAETIIEAQDIVNFKGLYQEIIIPLNSAIPEIYNRGKWRVQELITSARLLDIISFQRGRENECILVEPLE